MKKAVCFICLLLTAAVVSSCAALLPEQYEATESNGIIYKTAGDTDVMLEILYPTKRLHKKNPTVIALHGGGWISGSAEDFSRDFSPLCDILRENGITVVTVDYRLAIDGLTWRDCLEDCEDAFTFLLGNADEYDIDTENIGIIGYSAGAQLALLTSIETGDQIKYCVSLSGPTTFTMQRENPYYSDTLAYYVGLAFGDDLQLDIYKASPVIRINRRCGTDFLMVAGSDDEVVPASHAELFVREAESFGLEAETLVVDGLTHYYPPYADFGNLCATIADKVIAKLTQK